MESSVPKNESTPWKSHGLEEDQKKTYQINMLMRMNFREPGVCTCPTCHQQEDDNAAAET
jgi:hypothetical protein